jgi:hypothetical protein
VEAPNGEARARWRPEGAKVAPEARAGANAALETAWKKFLRKHPAEAKRQQREARRKRDVSASLARSLRNITESFTLTITDEREGQTMRSYLRPRTRSPGEQKTSVQRAAAHARGEIENALRNRRSAYYLA